MKKIITTTAVVLMSLTSIAALAQDKSIHIDFQSTEGDGVTFNMSLPVTVIKSFRPQIEQFLNSDEFRQADVDFVAIWQAARESGPTEFLEINNEDVDVKVRTTGTHLLINGFIREEAMTFDVKLPLFLGDLFFSNIDNIDYDAIVAGLNELDGEELVIVQGDTVNGRIWIQ